MARLRIPQASNRREVGGRRGEEATRVASGAERRVQAFLYLHTFVKSTRGSRPPFEVAEDGSGRRFGAE